jgi:hypothetical protein
MMLPDSECNVKNLYAALIAMHCFSRIVLEFGRFQHKTRLSAGANRAGARSKTTHEQVSGNRHELGF